MPAAGLVMSCLQYVIDFVISYTSTDLEINPYVEEISINPSESSSMLDD
jgi:hypothetical protein